MRSSHVCGLTLASSLIAFGVGLGVAPNASADPNDTDPTDASTPPPAAAAVTSAAPVSADADPAAVDACKQFAAALNFASTNYEDFAYDSAGGGNNVNYDDPSVANDNVVGRTALRQAAAAAMQASATPGLQPEIATPMQTWSMHATKLLLVMGLRGGGDALNSTATDMNTDAHNAQMACAQAGTHA